MAFVNILENPFYKRLIHRKIHGSNCENGMWGPVTAYVNRKLRKLGKLINTRYKSIQI